MFDLPVGTALTDNIVKAHINPQDHPLVRQGAWRIDRDQDAHSADFRVTRPDGTIPTLHLFQRGLSRADGRRVTMRADSPSTSPTAHPGVI